MLDTLIIGGSAAGAAAAIYGARAELKLKLVTDSWGGEVALSGEVLNYPGFSQTNGIALSDLFKKHVEDNKVDIELGVRVESITKTGSNFEIKGKKDGKSINYESKTVIVATGVHPRLLGIPGEKELKNRGVSYCSVCDGPIFKNRIVATIGGGNSALESILMLSKIATKVYAINKNPAFKGEAAYVHQIEKLPNVEVIYNAQTQKILGENVVSGVEYLDKNSNEIKKVDVQGVFVHIGLVPNSSFVDVDKDKLGQIIVDKFSATSVEGIYAAGDVTDVPYNQIVIAAGQGSTAALSVVGYLNRTN